jgi:hypothetical protein
MLGSYFHMPTGKQHEVIGKSVNGAITALPSNP